jgi:arylsulfatase A-like enzyme
MLTYLALLFPAAGKATEQPNILFIICDDLNDTVEGFGGHPQAYTPNIDRLATRGVRFLNANNNAPLCSPSRPSMLTGLYPHTTGYFSSPGESPGANGSNKYSWKHEVFEKSVTWMQHFRNNGYDVHGAGKIDHNYAERWTDWHVDGALRYGPKPSWGPFPFKGSGVRTNSTDMNFALAKPHPAQPEVSALSFFVPLSDVPDSGWYLYNRPYRYISETDRDPLPDELLAEYAKDFFATRPASGDDRPFFLNIGINRPHAPLVAPEKYFDLFPLDEVQLALRKDNDLDDCAPFLWKNFENGRVSRLSGFGKYEKKIKLGYMKQWTQAYLACIAFADDMIGQILTALENSPYADNTVVVFTSDHGYHMGEKDYHFKLSAWEESARIPLVVAGPGIARGRECTAPVSLIDLYPTFIDLAGLDPRPHPHLPLDGHSLVPLLHDPEQGEWLGPDVALMALVSRDMTTGKPLSHGIGKAGAQVYSVRSER